MQGSLLDAGPLVTVIGTSCFSSIWTVLSKQTTRNSIRVGYETTDVVLTVFQDRFLLADDSIKIADKSFFEIGVILQHSCKLFRVWLVSKPNKPVEV